MKRLLSVTLFTGLLTLLRMASGFAIAKVVAIYTGPSGMAVLGQVQGLVAALSGIVSAPCGSAMVRFTAENQSRGIDACTPWWRAGFKWTLVLLIICMPTACFFSKTIAQWLFNNPNYAWVVWLTSLVLPFSALNTLIASVINGFQNYRRYIVLGMISVFVSTSFMIVMIFYSNLTGALAAAAVSTSISGLVMVLGSINQPWFRLQYWWGNTNKEQLKQVGGYVAMAMTTALTIPLSLMFLRTILINRVGLEAAGQWQAVWKISEVYLGIITIALSTYYLPRLSALKTQKELNLEINNTAKVIMPLVVFLACLVYLFRDYAISFLFTEAFRPARDLFLIQLIGDVIKILAFIYAYPMIAKGDTVWFISSEVVFSFLFVILGYFLIQSQGVHGLNLAYCINYFMYLMLMIYYCFKRR